MNFQSENQAYQQDSGNGFAPVQIVKPPSFRIRNVLALLGMTCGVGVIGGILMAIVNVAASAAGLAVFGIAIGLFIIVSTLFRRKHTEKKVRAIAGNLEKDDPALLFRRVTKEISWSPPTTIVPKVLIEQGKAGQTYQVWWKEPPPVIDPLTITFEPRLLDEADPAFDELVSATNERDAPSESERMVTSRDDLLSLRGVKRNVTLKGGWIVIIGFSFCVIIQGIISFKQGRITHEFWLWLFVFGVMLLAPARMSLFKAKQLLLVPGGLVLRKAKWRDKQATLHLFDRRRSIMCVYPLRRRLWLMTVADADVTETVFMTERELDLLLRAWLSPLEPPAVERLSDMI